MFNDEYDYNEYELCPGCGGGGCIDIGDCEDGVTEVCPTCEGYGEIKI